MKKYNHPIDDFFREALQDHQMAPSDAARKAFLKDAMQPARPGKRGRNGIIVLSILLALVGSGLMIWAISSNKTQPNNAGITAMSSDNVHAASQLPEQKTQQQTSSKQHLTIEQPGKQPIQISKQSKPAVIHNASRVRRYESQDKNYQTTKSPAIAANTYTPLAEAVHGGSTSPVDVAQPVAYPGDAGNLQSAAVPVHEIPAADTTPVIKKPDSTGSPVSNIAVKVSDPNVKKSNWIPEIGVSYTPEWMFNTLEGTKFVNNFGIEGTFHFDRFSVRTGAGLSIAQGTNELVVEYNDFLGTYNKLDSMDFTWNEPIKDYTPTMYISHKEVWDSLMKLEYARVVKRYTYIQVPMIMGYDFWQTGRISIGVRVGPVMSILLATKQLSAAYDPGTKRVISINDIAPQQVNLNWQVMGGINAAFRLTDALKFEIEPCARYYFNSVYEMPANNTKPWSVGVRAAFVIKF
jgi:hypothetical protein